MRIRKIGVDFKEYDDMMIIFKVGCQARISLVSCKVAIG